MVMDFSTIAYAKLEIEFDRDIFIKEYDDEILPRAGIALNNKVGLIKTYNLNKIWKMIPEFEYLTTDYFEQEGDIKTAKKIDNGRPMWKMFQLMRLDTTNIDDPLLKEWAGRGTSGFRNETLDERYKFYLKREFKNLEIIKWITNNLPFKKINSIHCVSLEPNSFASIHRDSRSFKSKDFTPNKVFQSGYITVNLNITNGGVPLYWALDGKGLSNSYKSDDLVYITNDYFYHGVPICTSRRRQIRITGIPDDRFSELVNKESVIDLGPDYEFFPDVSEV
jgi:hypothetical protein